MSTSFAQKSTCRAPRRRLHVALSLPDGASTPLGSVLRTVRAAPGLGVGTLTVRVPPDRVREVPDLLDREAADLRRRAVRVTVLGRRGSFDPDLRRAAGTVERATAAGRRLHLRLAVGASSRDAIVAAFQGWDERPPRTRTEVSWILGSDGPPGAPVPDVDVLVLVGAARLADFLLWECARAEVRTIAADARGLRPSQVAAALAGRRLSAASRRVAAGARP